MSALALSATADQNAPATRVDLLDDGSSSIIRVGPGGERFLPHRYGDGLYRVADPSLGKVKHHAANQISIRKEEISRYLESGYLLRMRGEVSGKVNLIAASEIRVGE